MNDLIVLAASSAAIALMVGLAWALGFRRRAIIDDAELARQAGLLEPGATIEAAALDANGRAGLARLAGGKLLVARAMGADVGARVWPASAVIVRIRNGRVTATFADLGYPPLSLRFKGEAPVWLAALSSSQGARV